MRTTPYVLVALLLASLTIAATDGATNAGADGYDITGGDIYTVQLRYEPFPATPDNYVDVWYKIENRGDAALKDVVFELMPGFPFSLDGSDSAVKNLGTIDAHQSALVKFRVRVAANAVSGDGNLAYTWRAAGVENGKFSSSVSVRSGNSLLVVSGVKATPAKLSPGQTSTIAVDVTNAGDAYLRYVTVALGLVRMEGGSVVALPFSPAGKGLTSTLTGLAPGEKGTLEFTVAADPTAGSQTYKVPLSISYMDTSGRNATVQDLIGLTVAAEPDMIIYVDKNALRGPETPAEVVVRFVNKGRSDIKFLSVTLQKTGKYTILSSPESYIGEVNSDDYETTSFLLKLNGQQTDIDLPLVIAYEDMNGNKYSKGISLNVPVYDATTFGDGNGNFGTYAIIVLVVIVAGIIAWRRHHNSKHHK